MNDLELARSEFQANAYTFVIVKAGRVVATGTQDGIGELLDAAELSGTALRDAALVDKIVGKAVAMIAAHVGIAQVYSPLMSEAAQQVFNEYGIAFQAERTVPLIRNKRNDGPCPMEKLTMPLIEPADAVSALREFVAQRRMLVS